MSFLSPQMPQAPAPPPPPPNPPSFADPATQAVGTAARERAAAASGKGMGGTLMTGGEGATAPLTAGKALFGS
jgi:hypothetical protein